MLEHPAFLSVAGVQRIAPASRGEADYIKPSSLGMDSYRPDVNLGLSKFESPWNGEINHEI
jgi:hypothetical protein